MGAEIMIDTKKEQERDELHRAIWAIADELRGAVDGWDFKNYVLGTMFYRYISENLTSYINAGEIDAVPLVRILVLVLENIDKFGIILAADVVFHRVFVHLTEQTLQLLQSATRLPMR